MERDHFASGLTNEQLNFNSHAHVERDLKRILFSIIAKISTHTLTWSVTMGSLTAPYTKIISTHTLTWSVTCGVKKFRNKCNFNSHAHVERDQTKTETLDLKNNFNSHAHVERDIIFDGKEWNTKISTHTLTWSVTYNGGRNGNCI